MITRAQYMERSGEVFRAGGDTMAVHREYYAQFVNESTISTVVQWIGGERLLASTDRHLNDIPMPEWAALCGYRQVRGDIQWYAHRPMRISDRFEEAGTWCSPSDLTCIAKEAARQWIERQEA